MDTTEILRNPEYVVPVQQPGDRGVAWLRGMVPRFAEGGGHRRRRTIAERMLAEIDVEGLRRPGAPVANLAEAVGLPRAAAPDVALVAACYQPHLPVSADGDEAVARLVAAAGGHWDEETAVRISLLVQAHDATRAVIAGQEPPVATTRRVAPDGSEVVVGLAGEPFGAGRHACPARPHAEALVDGARAFRRMHQAEDLLILPNAWDVASALALVEAGFPAIGTTSLGVAAAHGLPDATSSTRAETLELARRLVALPVPVTVDIEYGLGADPAELAGQLSVLGVAGVNLEDGRPGGLAPTTEGARLIRSVKRAAPELFVNARVDTYWRDSAVQETRHRAESYVEAGADGVFVPGLREPEIIRDLVDHLPVPINLLSQLPLRELRDLGVRRVSTGSLLFRAAIQATVDAAAAIRTGNPVAGVPTYDEVAARTLRRS
ncbi:2-methylisocitrate lyase-like PEP mutase family enzyme [Lipingzhangella halophila]|uniref:2-methylisocitrate lyase-like PEP mutase family enzyme n=1 Tax=Lipingzhangella halophila TaxID=1783352 RepID=A0A7W7RL19_9ACTN|nr:isocitrate lyase/phosphoenolpyruvate mutase family protein [Lipingzhangella halophila]MBB4933949.1 2-methylisocitrate lyase-like PEP mutase family enzyme [Lipingzhangella halophila]